MWMVVLKSPSMATFQVMRFGSLTAQMDECIFMFRWFWSRASTFFLIYYILRCRDALEQVFRWKFKFVRIVQIKIWSVFAYSKHLFFLHFFPWHFQPSIKQRKPQRCGFEGVLERDRARRISKMELRCFAPSRTVGFGRVFLMHTDAFGELTVRHQGMLELEPRYILGSKHPKQDTIQAASKGGKDWDFLAKYVYR